MIKQTFFLLLLCLTIKGNDFELLSQMADFDFGKTIIETIQIELSSGDNSSDKILALLKQMKSSTESEMNESKEQIRARQTSCGQKLDEISALLRNAEGKRADDLRSQPLKEEELNDKQSQLQDKLSQEQRNKDRIVALETERQSEIVKKQYLNSYQDQFKERRNEVFSLINTLNQAKQIISQLASKSSFLQKTQEVNQKIQKHSKQLKELLGEQNGYLELIQMLMETASDKNIQADSKLVGSVVSIIDELAESLRNMQRAEQKAEDQKNQIFLTQRARFQLEITTMEASLATLRADSEHLKQKLLELSNDISSKDALINQKKQEQNDWAKTCTDEYRNYERIQKQKNDEMDIITSCIEIFETRFTDAVKSYVQKMSLE